MLVDYTVVTDRDHIQVGKENGQYTAVSLVTGLKASNANPLLAITQVIGSVAPAARRVLLREIADRA